MVGADMLMLNLDEKRLHSEIPCFTVRVRLSHAILVNTRFAMCFCLKKVLNNNIHFILRENNNNNVFLYSTLRGV